MACNVNIIVLLTRRALNIVVSNPNIFLSWVFPYVYRSGELNLLSMEKKSYTCDAIIYYLTSKLSYVTILTIVSSVKRVASMFKLVIWLMCIKTLKITYKKR